MAWSRLQTAETTGTVVTRRHVASLIGLMFWMADTIDIPIHAHYDVMRLFAQLAQDTAKWDAPFLPSGTVLNALGKLAGPLLRNASVVPMTHPPASLALHDYDAVVIVDAAATGVGAFVLLGNIVYEVRGGFGKAMMHSAHAEPIGATEILRWVRAKGARNVAVVTDHNAMVWGQRRPWSAKGGFSKSYFLNQFFTELYENGGGQVFFVEGARNPSDHTSRSNRLGDPMSARIVKDMTFPLLTSFFHPYLEKRRRPWWNV